MSTSPESSKSAKNEFWTYKQFKQRDGQPVQFVYCSTKAESEAVSAMFLGEQELGFAVEWVRGATTLTTDPLTTRIQQQIPVLQLASRSTVAIFHLAQHKESGHEILATSLKQLLESRKILKCGSAMARHGGYRLSQYLGIRPQGLLELSSLQRAIADLASPLEKPPTAQTSLVLLVEHYLGLPLSSAPELRLSNWSEPLSIAQQEYAANKAFAALVLFDAMLTKSEGLPASSITIPLVHFLPPSGEPGTESKWVEGAAKILFHDFRRSSTADGDAHTTGLGSPSGRLEHSLSKIRHQTPEEEAPISAPRSIVGWPESSLSKLRQKVDHVGEPFAKDILEIVRLFKAYQEASGLQTTQRSQSSSISVWSRNSVSIVKSRHHQTIMLKDLLRIPHYKNDPAWDSSFTSGLLTTSILCQIDHATMHTQGTELATSRDTLWVDTTGIGVEATRQIIQNASRIILGTKTGMQEKALPGISLPTTTTRVFLMPWEHTSGRWSLVMIRPDLDKDTGVCQVVLFDTTNQLCSREIIFDARRLMLPFAELLCLVMEWNQHTWIFSRTAASDPVESFDSGPVVVQYAVSLMTGEMTAQDNAPQPLLGSPYTIRIYIMRCLMACLDNLINKQTSTSQYNEKRARRKSVSPLTPVQARKQLGKRQALGQEEALQPRPKSATGAQLYQKVDGVLPGKRIAWTESELASAKQMWKEGKNKTEIGRVLGRAASVVSRKLIAAGVTYDDQGFGWSDAQTRQATEMVKEGHSEEEIAEAVGKPTQAVHEKLKREGLSANSGRWPTWQWEKAVQLQKDGLTAEQVGNEIGRNKASVLHKFRLQGLSFSGKRSLWTEELRQEALDLSLQGRTSSEIAEVVGTTEKAVRQMFKSQNWSLDVQTATDKCAYCYQSSVVCDGVNNSGPCKYCVTQKRVTCRFYSKDGTTCTSYLTGNADEGTGSGKSLYNKNDDRCTLCRFQDKDCERPNPDGPCLYCITYPEASHYKCEIHPAQGKEVSFDTRYFDFEELDEKECKVIRKPAVLDGTYTWDIQ